MAEESSIPNSEVPTSTSNPVPDPPAPQPLPPPSSQQDSTFTPPPSDQSGSAPCNPTARPASAPAAASPRTKLPFGIGRVPLPGQAAAPSTLASTVDALDLWGAEARSADGLRGQDIRLARFGDNEGLYLLFMRSLVRAVVHYLDSASYRGYLLCNDPGSNGEGCHLCRAGRKPSVIDLLPAYDALERRVVVLPITSNERPGALRPQLAPILRQMAQQDAPSLLVGISKASTGRFLVNTFPLPEGADDGVAVIAPFCDRFAAGEIDLTGVYTHLSNEELAAIPEIAAGLRLRGITPA